ncbi:nitroreductase [Breznakia sp. PF5-3]|uniref:nitroreductase family protein n=1 Tax=unclassified Breznakia TaxID=2623764 RepID=UPI002405598D|nr:MULTISPECIES: nitroreductase family protein [unclassified Breznakia]MDF9825248.1 nitroreductase [Breznakia sp. PM6-1]MDF9836110.1 nitroreductase [Breznakia sp. PF5-3]MDF9838401.1 nitroreductase [Breznakia sp. PFB2-8]MDF9860417.1 nitroreductase [Breznakia sp. PH5-24]
MNEIIKSLNDRKSVRVFEDKEISAIDKEAIINAAIQAPSAGNQTMYTIIDVTDQELLTNLSKSCDNQPFIAKAKLALIFCADYQKWIDTFSIVENNPRKPGVGELLLGCNDALIAAQNAVVAAESLGIGSCYIGDIMEKYEYHKEVLNLPRYVFPVTMIVFGYPTEQQAKRKKPKRFDKQYVVHENTYKRMDDKTLEKMFVDRANLTPEVPFEFNTWVHAFYNRKYDSDFSKEMTRSIKAYIKDFDDE